MKNYKLIKKYPSLPSDWELGMEVGMGDRNWGYSPCFMNYFDKCLETKEVENNPEFWELVEELCVPIGTKFTTSTCIVYTVYKIENGKVWINWKEDKKGARYTVFEANQYFKDGDWKEVKEYKILETCPITGTIYKIKRLSDNETFTVGDYVQLSYFKDSWWASTNCKIKEIKEENNVITFNIAENGSESDYTFSLDQWRKVKKVLHVSNDGVELYHGDTFFHVDSYFNIGKGKINTSSFTPLKGIEVFSTQIAAKEWVYENKPEFSRKQIREVLNSNFDSLPCTLKRVKEKLEL